MKLRELGGWARTKTLLLLFSGQGEEPPPELNDGGGYPPELEPHWPRRWVAYGALQVTGSSAVRRHHAPAFYMAQGTLSLDLAGAAAVRTSASHVGLGALDSEPRGASGVLRVEAVDRLEVLAAGSLDGTVSGSAVFQAHEETVQRQVASEGTYAPRFKGDGDWFVRTPVQDEEALILMYAPGLI